MYTNHVKSAHATITTTATTTTTFAATTTTAAAAAAANTAAAAATTATAALNMPTQTHARNGLAGVQTLLPRRLGSGHQ
jgi:hypothetical protein